MLVPLASSPGSTQRWDREAWGWWDLRKGWLESFVVWGSPRWVLRSKLGALKTAILGPSYEQLKFAEYIQINSALKSICVRWYDIHYSVFHLSLDHDMDASSCNTMRWRVLYENHENHFRLKACQVWSDNMPNTVSAMRNQVYPCVWTLHQARVTHFCSYCELDLVVLWTRFI